MPRPGHRWRHVTFNTRNSWLHGDERGFRDRHHRIHSSGDYKRPPPETEHAGLGRWYSYQSGEVITLRYEVRERAGQAVLDKASAQGWEILTLCLGSMHGHALVELPDDPRKIKRIVGSWKQAASHAIKDQVPGKIWAAGCDAEPVDDPGHRGQVHGYILKHRTQGAWVYSTVANVDEIPW